MWRHPSHSHRHRAPTTLASSLDKYGTLCLSLSDPECDTKGERVQTDCGRRREAPPGRDLREPGVPEGQLRGRAGKASHARDESWVTGLGERDSEGLARRFWGHN